MFGGSCDAGSTARAVRSAARTSRHSSAIPFRIAALGGKVPIELEVNEECATCHGTRRRAGRQDSDVSRVPGPRNDLVRTGRFRRSASVSDVPRQRHRAERALPDVQRRGRSASAQEDDDHRRRRASTRGRRFDSRGRAAAVSATVRRAICSSPSRSSPIVSSGAKDSTCIAPVTINIAQATLGSKISVKTLDGKKVAIKIPPGTPTGKRFRVRGQGITAKARRRRPDRRGRR